MRIARIGRPRVGSTVLQVLPALGTGGVERGTIDMAGYLVEHNWRAIVASAGGPGEEDLEACGGIAVRLPVHAKNPFTIHANIRRLQRLIDEHGVSLVHARSRAPAWSAFYAARRANVPFVTTFHGVYQGSDHVLKRRYNAIMAAGDRVIAISDFVADHIRTCYPAAAGRLRVVPRGVDTTAFNPDAVSRERVNRLAEQWRLPPGRKVVMLPGRVVRRKGHLLALRAIERMARRDFLCVMVGAADHGSSYPQEVEALINATGLEKVVRMVGDCDDMPAAFMLADAVIVPSTRVPEPFGRVSIEAQAMARPVIVTDVGGLGESLMPAATGWLVPPDDPAELARAMELALALPDDARARLAVRARRFVNRNFTIEQMGRNTLAVYRDLLEGGIGEDDDAAIGVAA